MEGRCIFREKHLFGNVDHSSEFHWHQSNHRFIYRNILSHKPWRYKEEACLSIPIALKKRCEFVVLLVFIEIILIAEYPTEPKLFLFKTITALMVLLGSIESGIIFVR